MKSGPQLLQLKELKSGTVLQWNTDRRFDKTESHWILLDEHKANEDHQRVFNMYCLYSTRKEGFHIYLHTETTYTFGPQNLHRFTLKSQV
jgi:hypothetical protein